MSSKTKSKRAAQAPAATDDPSSSSKEARLSAPPTGNPQPTISVGRSIPPGGEIEVDSPVTVTYTRNKWVSPPAAGAKTSAPHTPPGGSVPQSSSSRSSLSGDDSKEEAIMDVEEVAPAQAAMPSSPMASPVTPPDSADLQTPPVIDIRRLKSFHVGADKLRYEADIDARSATQFKVSLAVDPRYPGFAPVDFAALSSKNSNRGLAGFNALVKLLGHEQLGLRAPRIPRAIVGLMTEKMSADLVPSLTAGQQTWLREVGEHMTANGADILSGRGSERRRFNASNELLECLTSAESLWESNELTNYWSDLLMKDTTVKRISQDDDDSEATLPQKTGKQSGRSKRGKKSLNPSFYMLHLQCAGREVAFIIGCVLTRCALLPLQTDMLSLTQQVMQLLDSSDDPVSPAESTDSDDSDSEDPRASHSGWLKVKSKRPKRSVSGYERNRQVRERLTKEIKALQRKPEFQGQLSRLRQESEHPLLLLSTHISPLRAWVTRYTSIQVDNLHTICDMRSADLLREDRRFQQLSSIPQLAEPNAWWKITQTDNGVYTALWMREDLADVLPKLPELIQQKLGLESAPPLIFRCTFYQTTKNGHFIPRSAITVTANDNAKIARPSVPFTRPLPALYQPPPVTAAPSAALPAIRRQSPPPPPNGSWAQRVLHAAVTVAQKRAPSNPSLNHQPRKEQRTGSPAASPLTPAPGSQPSATTDKPAASSSSRSSSSSSSSSSSANAPPAKRGTQPANLAASSESAAHPSMASMMKELKEQREELAAYRKEMADNKSREGSKNTQWEQLMSGMQSQLKELQDLVMESRREYTNVKEMITQLGTLVSARFTGSMSISPVAVPVSGNSIAHPQPSASTPSSSNAEINQLRQLVMQQQQQMQHLQQQLGQQQQQPLSTTHSASAIPARNDSGMAVNDE
jgi:hypothetical protein